MESHGLISTGASLTKLFFAALAIRCGYDLALYLAMGNEGLMGVDSADYLHRARHFASLLSNSGISGWDWFNQDPMQMPLFSWATGLSALVSPYYVPLIYALFQAVIDSATCLLIFCIAKEADPRFALPAAIAAAINPTQIVLAGLFYPDTAFTFFVALLTLGAMRWVKALTWPATSLIVLGLVGAAYTRILIAPFGVALLGYLIIAAAYGRRLTGRALGLLGTSAIVFALALGTISLRNHAQFGSWQLTPQTGMHLSRWIVPLIQEAKDGTPWRTTYEKLERRTENRFGTIANNPFMRSYQYTQIAEEEIPRLGFVPAIKAWLFGAAINLGTPAIVLSPPVIHLPRTGFYDTRGATMIQKIFNFMFRSDNAHYAWILLAGVCGTVLIRLIQLAGFISLVQTRRHFAALLVPAGFCMFILLLNGPVASPKYRLPMEPALVVLTGAGWVALRRRCSSERVLAQEPL